MTVVEWGHGIAELLSPDRLELELTGETERTVRLTAHGKRWSDHAVQLLTRLSATLES